MCGIAGIVGHDATPERVTAMFLAQTHRGPDGGGCFIHPTQPVGLAHNRMAIVETGPLGQQPMQSSNGRYTIVFNGEIYNALELRQELANSYPFHSHSDTEVILAAYQTWGKDCLSRFNGQWAFAIWDDREQQLFCARDRLGVRPLLIYDYGDSCYFASEAKAFLAAGITLRPDYQAWARYLTYGTYSTSRTFFDNVIQLPPGQWCCIALSGERMGGRFWNPSQEPDQHSPTWRVMELRRLLEDSVKLRLRADVPIGLNYSGGLDSSIILHLMHELLPRETPLWLFQGLFDHAGYDEEITGWKQHLARPVNLVNTWTDPMNVSQYASSIMAQEEMPFGGINTIMYHQVHREAQFRNVKVLLEGQGADELFGGYAYYQQSGQHQDGSSYLRPDLATSQAQELAGTPSVMVPRITGDIFWGKLPRVLLVHDRVAMTYGRELRQPYLDYRVAQLALQTPDTEKIVGHQGKAILREAARGLVPEGVRTAPKQGRTDPQVEWLRCLLAPWVRSLFEAPDFGWGLVERAGVIDAYRKFCAGEGENGMMIWQWINLALWFRRFGAPSC